MDEEKSTTFMTVHYKLKKTWMKNQREKPDSQMGNPLENRDRPDFT